MHEFTKGGNLKAPSRALLCQWVKSAWEAVSIESVTKSFLSCEITTSTNGNDDHEIHCFKPNQPCGEAGRIALQQQMELLNATPVSTEDLYDPFSSDEDEEEIEHNEVSKKSLIVKLIVTRHNRT